MKKINYKCSSCGGKVDYNNENVLTCLYCNKTFDSIIKNKFDASKIIEKMEVYTYFCSNCDYEYKTKNSISGTAICPKCKNKLEKNKQIINGLIPMTMTKENAKKIFYNELKKIDDLIPKEFLESDFNLEYIRCRVYEGTIKVTAKKNNQTISKDYPIYNLPIPTNKKFNYNQKVDLLSTHLDTKKALYDKEKLEQLVDEKNLCIDLSKETEIEDLKEACVKDFKKVNTGVDEGITVEAFIDTKHNFYLPSYSSSTLYNGKTYYNYIFFIGEDILFCCDFPKIDEKKYIQYEKTNSNMKKQRFFLALFLCLMFCILIMVTNFIIMSFKDKPSSAAILILITWMPVFLCHTSIIKRKYQKNEHIKISCNIFENSQVTKDEYFNNAIIKYNKDTKKVVK